MSVDSDGARPVPMRIVCRRVAVAWLLREGGAIEAVVPRGQFRTDRSPRYGDA